MRSPFLRALLVCASAVSAIGLFNLSSGVRAVSPDIVISQIYGGGGNSGSVYRNDFIELFNRGSVPVSVEGWSVQYASNTGSSWQVTPLTGTIAPGAYYLVQEAAGAGGTTSLPAPNAVGTIPMSATAGKVALVSNITALSGAVASNGVLRGPTPNAFPSCPSVNAAAIVDFAGFGSSTTCFEGTGPAPAPSNTTAALRKDLGALDTDVNASDFASGAPNPRTTPVTSNPSGVLAANPETVTAGGTTALTVTVTPGTNPASSGLTVTADLTQIGGSAVQPFSATGANEFTFDATVPAGVTPGTKTISVTIEDAQGRSGSASASVLVISPLPTNPVAAGSATPATVAAGAATKLVVVVTPGANPTSTGVTVAADLSAIGGSASQAFHDDGLDGDQAAGDNRFTFDALVPAAVAAGVKTLPVSVADAQARTAATTIGLTVLGPAPKGVVISQIYGAGGNSGALFRNDFIELYNSTAEDVDLTGWSVQYASAAGTSWNNITTLTGTIGAGKYYLVRESGGTNGAPLPPFDASGGISMAAGSGKVALVNNASALTGSCPVGNIFIADFVGYGSSATCFEGTAATGTLSATEAALRLDGGAIDTDDNAADFEVGMPRPRSSFGIPPTGVGLASPQTVPNGTPSLLTVTVTEGSLPASAIVSVTADLTAIGGDTSATFVDDGTLGDVTANDSVFSLTQLVSGPPAVRTLTATIVDALARTSTASIRIGIDSPFTFAIHDVQGPGTTSPLDGIYLTTAGIVTALKFNGAFIQTPDADVDGDASSSEGIFVFTGGAPPAFLQVGDMVVATGTLQEFVPSADPASPPITEIVNSAFRVMSSGHSLPAPVTLLPEFTTATGGFEQLERFEGMRIRTSLVVVAPTQAAASDEKAATSVSNGIFYGVIQGVARPMREPGLEPEQVLPPGAPAGIPRFDGNPERLRVDSDALLGAAKLDVVAGQTFADFTGVLDYAFRSYMILPDPTDPGGNPWQPAGSALAIPVPVTGQNEFTVAHFNLERFFDTVDDAGSDVALTPAALEMRLEKASRAIRHVLRSPDVLGVIEVENLPVLQQLASRIGADAVAAGEPDPQYEAHLEEGNDIGGIDVGVLVKRAGDRVRALNVFQIGKDTDFTFGGETSKLNDRPTLVLEADVLSPQGRSYPVTVLVNHLRSLNGIDGTDGDRIRHKRLAQAEFLANYVQARQTANPAEWIVAVGDFNAFQFNDGYVDVMGTLTGAPAPADQVVLPSLDLVDPNLTNLVERLTPEQRYSFSFDGNAQVLDHVLVNDALLKQFARIAYARVDADFPEVFRNDPARPERISDHDAPVAFFSFPGAPIIALNGPAEMSVEYNSTFTDPGVTATDPVYPVVVTTTGAVNTAVLGDYTITYTASNPFLSASVTRTVHVVDTTAPAISVVTTTPGGLGVPSHRMIDVTVGYSATDFSGTPVCSLSVSSNEPTNGRGDGNTSTDWTVVDAHHVQLRAERAGVGNGRVYTITVRCTDVFGNVSSAAGTVSVPK